MQKILTLEEKKKVKVRTVIHPSNQFGKQNVLSCLVLLKFYTSFATFCNRIVSPKGAKRFTC